MTLFDTAWAAWGRWSYRLAARLAGPLLGLSGSLEGVMLHRSAATGEVRFGQSDLDLVLTLRPEATEGRHLARLLRHVRGVQMLVPMMVHREVYPPGSLEEFAARDTVWANIERRTLTPVFGRAARPPELTIEREHAVRRLLLWWEFFFTEALYGRSPASREKAALECWNFYAVAEGLLAEPLLLRSEMRAHLAASGFPVSSLREPESARRFVLGLSEHLHKRRFPELQRLERGFAFETILAPHGMSRRFVVLPHASAPLPGQTRRGDLVVTPELVDLFLHSKNAFMSWSLPPQMAALGLRTPSREAFARDALYMCAAHFLLQPGFTASVVGHPGVRLHYARQVANCLEKDRLPTPPTHWPQTLVRDPDRYYLEDYDALEQERRELFHRLRALGAV